MAIKSILLSVDTNKLPNLSNASPAGPVSGANAGGANKHAPCAVRFKLEDSLIEGISCKKLTRLIKSNAEALAWKGAKRTLHTIGGEFVDRRGKTRAVMCHYKEIIGVITRQA